MINVQEGSFGCGFANENWTGNLSGLNVATGVSFTGVEANVRVDVLTGAGTISSGYPGAGYQNFTFGVNNGSGSFSGTRIGFENQGFNLNGTSAIFNVATGADATSDLKVIGTLWNGGNVIKDGAGRMEITSTQEYSGTTTVTGGTLIVKANISTSSMTTVQTGASLGGSGTVGSDYNQADTLPIELTGTTPGIGGYDQVNVDLTTGDFDGSVTLSGSLVTAFSGGSYVNGNLLFILLNDESDAINGTFSGLAQDAIVTNYGGFDWKISYTANSSGNTFTGGNDVALMAVPEPNVAALLGGLGMLALLRWRR